MNILSNWDFLKGVGVDGAGGVSRFGVRKSGESHSDTACANLIRNFPTKGVWWTSDIVEIVLHVVACSEHVIHCRMHAEFVSQHVELMRVLCGVYVWGYAQRWRCGCFVPDPFWKD